MWVSSLEINNIKSFEASGTIHLNKKMNIILGANNAGKSTILRVLYRVQNQSSLAHSDIQIACSLWVENPQYVLKEMRRSEYCHVLASSSVISILTEPFAETLV